MRSARSSSIYMSSRIVTSKLEQSEYIYIYIVVRRTFTILSSLHNCEYKYSTVDDDDIWPTALLMIV